MGRQFGKDQTEHMKGEGFNLVLANGERFNTKRDEILALWVKGGIPLEKALVILEKEGLGEHSR